MLETADISGSRRVLTLLSLCAAIAVIVGGCIEIDDDADTLQVRAPAGMQQTLQLALQGYDGTLSGSPPRIVYDRTESNARAVLEEEAPAAVLYTDHPAWADYVARRSAVLRRRAIARDALVGIAAAPRGTPGDLAALADAEFERIAIPSTESAPAGMYAREALLRYGLWSSLTDRVVRADDARDAIGRVRELRADAAIVLASDLRAAGLEPTFRIDPAYHQAALIELLLLQDDPRSHALFDYLSGSQATAAFQAQGYAPPE